MDIAGYIEEAPAERQEALRDLREACLSELNGFEEVMAYGMPGYTRDGDIEVGFASQKQYISLYILRTDVFETHRDKLAGLSLGKGAIRYKRPDQIDMEVVRSMLQATAASKGQIC
jgi:uncharacterized protein YdhG (YjbR/CyaY superfamily)